MANNPAHAARAAQLDAAKTPWVPCETCGYPTPILGTERCNGCWEVEHRIESYLQTGKVKAVRVLALALFQYVYMSGLPKPEAAEAMRELRKVL